MNKDQFAYLNETIIQLQSEKLELVEAVKVLLQGVEELGGDNDGLLAKKYDPLIARAEGGK